MEQESTKLGVGIILGVIITSIVFSLTGILDFSNGYNRISRNTENAVLRAKNQSLEYKLRIMDEAYTYQTETEGLRVEF